MATLMLASAAFALKAIFRRVILQPDTRLAARALYATPIVCLLAITFVVCAVFALKLRRWALVGYLAGSAVGVAYAFAAGFRWHLAVPLLIGACAVSGILIARRELL